MSGSEIASNILDDLIDSIAFNDDSFPNHNHNICELYKRGI